jgi:psp operon transcriptional activator
VHDIVLNPFESKYRPQQRTKARATVVEPVDATSSATNSVTQTEEHPPLTSGISDPFGFEFPMDLKQASQDYEISMLQQALEDSQYNQKKTAEKLSLTYHQLRGYLKKYNLLENTESA